MEFSAGITALVGPNGSGKSNVVDAVRWCLGEQSMRDLRGQRTEDVIYAGARRLLGVSEVALTLDSRTIPEMCIARRLYRSGDSEYLVNSRRVRLRDVLEIQRDVGIDPGRFVIVSQGMADELLSASAAERRNLVEQAGGLSGYRDRRDEARQKVSTVQRNIETIVLVLGELEPRLKMLRRQAKAINDRDEAVRNLREQLFKWYGARWRALSHKANELKVQADSSAAARKMSAERLERLEAEVQEAIDRERDLHQRQQAISAAIHLTEREIETTRHELVYLERRVLELEEASCERMAGLTRIQRQLQSVSDEHRDAITSLQELCRRAEAHQQQESEAREHLATCHGAVAQAVQQEAKWQGELQSATDSHSKLSQKANELRFVLNQHTVRLEELRTRDSNLKLNVEAAAREVEGLRADLETAEKEAQRRHEVLDLSVGQLDQAQFRIDRLEHIVRQASLASLEASSQLRSLDASMEHMAEQVGGDIVQTLAVVSGWETAVSAALGEWVGAGVNSGANIHEIDARPFLEWRGTLDLKLGETVCWADSVVRGFEPHLVNPLSATILVDDEIAAGSLWSALRDLPGHTVGSPPVQVVTRSGTRWNAVGVRSAPTNDPTAQLLRARHRHRTACRRIQHRESRLRRMERALAKAREAHADIRRLAVDAEEHYRAAVALRAELANTVERSLLQYDAQRNELTRNRQEMKTLDVRVATTRKELAELEGEFPRSQAMLASCFEVAKQSSDHVEETRANLTTQMERASTVQRDRDVYQVKIASQKSRAGTLEAHVARLKADLLATERAETSSTAEVQRLIAEAKNRRAALGDLESQLADQLQTFQTLRQTTVCESASKETLRNLRHHQSSAISTHEQSIAALMHAEQELRLLAEEIYKELGAEPGQLPSGDIHPPSDEEIRKIRTRAMQYADLDLGVLQEYSELQDRQNYLSANLSDLQSALNDLHGIIQTADVEMKDRFAVTFEAVNERFRWTFRTMLGGGEAQLERTDDQGSIEVRAQLPGRRARTSVAYSGGERALVALALLFAVLGYKPSPFCILDEVDAALDESNVDRYLALLREMSRQTQMVLVTHNRATMAAADALYGLTMDDEGVSSLLSIRLEAFEPAFYS